MRLTDVQHSQRAEPMRHDTNAHRLYIIRLIRKVRRRNDFTQFKHRISVEMPYVFHRFSSSSKENRHILASVLFVS